MRYRISRLLVIAAVVLFTIGCDNREEQFLITNGVSEQIAEYRDRTISDIRYSLYFDIPDNKTTPIEGRVDIKFDINSVIDNGVVLDFAVDPSFVRDVIVDGESVNYLFESEHIILDSSLFSKESGELTVLFTAGDMSLNRRDELLYTLFVPDRARTAFPCFDQPNLKAKVSLKLLIPNSWDAVANGRELSSESVDSKRLLTFAETEPLPTYLIAFTAGEYKRVTRNVDGVEMNFLHRESDSVKVASNLDMIFTHHKSALDWLESYTKIEYPFGKFDFVAIPSFQYGGMEHPGSIWYKAASLFIPEEATLSSRRSREHLISHETSHMWFGDLVTMEWFSEVWLKEVFANFMTDKIIEPNYPEIDFDLSFLMAHYPSAYSVDRTIGANAITQQLPNLNGAGALYGGIIYHKAPIVMRQLEDIVGAKHLQIAIERYLKEFSYGNATWDQLIDIIISVEDNIESKKELEMLKEWSRVWIYEAGMPIISSEERSVDSASADSVVISFNQTDPLGESRIWSQRLNPYVVYQDGTSEIFSVEVGDSIKTKGGVVATIPNGKGQAYGSIELSESSVEWLLNSVESIDNNVTRASAYLTLYENMLNGGVAPVEMIGMLNRSIKGESSTLILTQIAGYIKSIFWISLNESERAQVAELIEQTILDQINIRDNLGEKRLLFKSWVSIVTTPEGINRLSAIVESGADSVEWIPELSITERERIVMGYELAVRSDVEAEEIMSSLISTIESQDRVKEVKFIAPALSSNLDVRRALFSSLKIEENRAQEPWVGTALKYLNHPLRASLSEEFIIDAVALGPEIQETGDIFFPTNWFSSMFWGHTSMAVKDRVMEYLDSNPDYPYQLKLKLLQAIDHI